jgi:hypothetical protein
MDIPIKGHTLIEDRALSEFCGRAFPSLMAKTMGEIIAGDT